MRIVWPIILLLIANAANASLRDLPHFRVPDAIGVNIHFVDPNDDEMDMIQAAGFGVLRMDLVWASVEREKGVYDFEGYIRLTEAMRKRGQIPMYILDYSNPLYEEGHSVVTPEGRKAFARFAAEALIKLGQGPVIWEIWNEPNLEHFWAPQPSAQDYLALVKETVEVLRKIDPLCTIAAPATSRIPKEFIEELFKGGLLDSVDAVSVHPYRSSEPETAYDEYRDLRELIDRYSPEKFIPILSGEWGYSVYNDGRVLIDQEQQARYLVRQLLTNFMAGVRVSIWYDWKNDGDDPEEKEHNFGTVEPDLTPKLAYWAVKTFSQQTRDMTFISRLPSEQPEDYLLLFSNGERETLAAWTTGRTHLITLTLDASIDQAVTMLGETAQLYRVGEKLEIELSQSPIYMQAARIHPAGN